MKFEVWTFTDEGGVAWWLQSHADKYDAFLRYLEVQDEAEAELVHTFEATTKKEGFQIFDEYMDGLMNPGNEM